MFSIRPSLICSHRSLTAMREPGFVVLDMEYTYERNALVCGMAAEVALILLMIRGRVFRIFPTFFIYLCWSLLSDTLFYYVGVGYPPATFFRISLIQLAVDSAMIFALLVEIA